MGNRSAMLVACALLVVATITAYSNMLRYPFVFDDVHDIVENHSIRQLWPIWQVFVADPSGKVVLHGRPVVNLSFALNYATGGLGTFHYHLTNLAIHVLASLTLFGILRRTLGFQERYAQAAVPLAFAIAGIWSLHPLQTQAVTYVVQRYESMMGLFYLLSLYCAIRSDSSRHPHWWAAGSVVACLLGLGSKEVAVSAPLIILLYDRAFLAGSFREAWRRRWGLYSGLAATWVAFAVLLVFSRQTRAGWSGWGLEASWWEYGLTQFGVILHYLRLSICPYGQVFDYAWPLARSASEIVPGALVVGGLAAASLWLLVYYPKWGVVGAWFFLILAPTSSIMPIADRAFEHRMYLSLAAVAAVVVLIGHEILTSGKVSLSSRGGKLVYVVPVVAVLVVLGATTFVRSRVYASDFSLWKDVVEKVPWNARAQYNLGLAAYRLNQMQEAIVRYRKALDLEPQMTKAHYNLAMVLGQQRKYDLAVAHFETALRLDPRDPDCHFNLAEVLSALGRTAEAVAHYQRALELNPRDAACHSNLASILAGQGKVDEALLHYQEAVRLRPDSAEFRCELGRAFYVQGKGREAIGQWREALRLRPDIAALLNLLAWECATCPNPSVRNGADAVEFAQRACRLGNPSVELLDALAAAYAETGRFADAVRAAEEALAMASKRGDADLAEALRGRIKLYEAGKPFRDPKSPIARPEG